MKYLRDTEYCSLTADEEKTFCHNSACNCDTCKFNIFETHTLICMITESSSTILGSKLNVGLITCSRLIESFLSLWLDLSRFVSVFLGKNIKWIKRFSEVHFELQWFNSICILDFYGSQNLYQVSFIPMNITQLTKIHWPSINCFSSLLDLML